VVEPVDEQALQPLKPVLGHAFKQLKPVLELFNRLPRRGNSPGEMVDLYV
jgi:hypothetical protein